MSRPRVVLLNGSLRGASGNTGWLLAETAARLTRLGAEVHTWTLAAPLPPVDDLLASLRSADAFVVGTGVYWHSWGSPLQRFLEVFTPQEGTEAFVGKPVSALVTMDSVGGSELAARLLHVFGSLGCVVPPCSTLVLSRLALRSGGGLRPLVEDEDVWSLEDLDVVLHNTLAACADGDRRWRTWGCRPLTAPRGPYPLAGPLDLGSPRFLPPAAPRA